MKAILIILCSVITAIYGTCSAEEGLSGSRRMEQESELEFKICFDEEGPRFCEIGEQPPEEEEEEHIKACRMASEVGEVGPGGGPDSGSEDPKRQTLDHGYVRFIKYLILGGNANHVPRASQHYEAAEEGLFGRPFALANCPNRHCINDTEHFVAGLFWFDAKCERIAGRYTPQLHPTKKGALLVHESSVGKHCDTGPHPITGINVEYDAFCARSTNGMGDAVASSCRTRGRIDWRYDANRVGVVIGMAATHHPSIEPSIGFAFALGPIFVIPPDIHMTSQLIAGEHGLAKGYAMALGCDRNNKPYIEAMGVGQSTVHSDNITVSNNREPIAYHEWPPRSLGVGL